MLPDLCDYFFKVNLKFIIKIYVLLSFFAQTYFFFNTEAILISTRKKNIYVNFAILEWNLGIRIENNTYSLCMEFTNIVQRKKVDHSYLLYLWYENCLNTTLKIICDVIAHNFKNKYPVMYLNLPKL